MVKWNLSSKNGWLSIPHLRWIFQTASWIIIWPRGWQWSHWTASDVHDLLQLEEHQILINKFRINASFGYNAFLTWVLTAKARAKKKLISTINFMLFSRLTIFQWLHSLIWETIECNSLSKVSFTLDQVCGCCLFSTKSCLCKCFMI